jgi:hypothetical protein
MKELVAVTIRDGGSRRAQQPAAQQQMPPQAPATNLSIKLIAP